MFTTSHAAIGPQTVVWRDPAWFAPKIPGFAGVGPVPTQNCSRHRRMRGGDPPGQRDCPHFAPLPPPPPPRVTGRRTAMDPHRLADAAVPPAAGVHAGRARGPPMVRHHRAPRPRAGLLPVVVRWGGGGRWSGGGIGAIPWLRAVRRCCIDPRFDTGQWERAGGKPMCLSSRCCREAGLHMQCDGQSGYRVAPHAIAHALPRPVSASGRSPQVGLQRPARRSDLASGPPANVS
jgi:hypothetical protein